ncbi:hypothetical protein PDESU_06064 [Pontiella desulfatans]|uniref:VWFA domain-containing protein n=1 Tax=Pontiella desulfatans TaxID=2750659 RepID=A0A6C2UBE3_PONDE|nr:hypothetical protein [Pontiella desulfatans]VGO17468.1 hypothetical protein PDESU_06064 [Pontiella desulfatans]
MSVKKRFFANHAKSSAAIISLAIHAILILIAFTFVAVTVITKEDPVFETKQVKRPKMPMRKLQVPVNVKKKQIQKPKLRKRIVVQPKVNQNMPDIRMPEISGVKGGMGGGIAGGIGGGGGVGFTMPEIEVFGIKGKGEKVFIILDSSTEMMWDEMGGIPAYTIIKEELVKIIGGLPPTALFNVIVYDQNRTFMLFPQMVAASSHNVGKVDSWLKPLNSVKPGMGVDEFGVSTLGEGGAQNSEDLLVGKFERQESWYRPSMLAMKQQADAVFVLTYWWGHQRIETGNNKIEQWKKTTPGKKWIECHEEAKRLLDEDNKQRLARGEAPRAINRNNAWDMNRAYFPDIERPPQPDFYYHKPQEYAQAMLEIRERNKPNDIQSKSGLSRKSTSAKVDFSFNVVRFAKKDAEWNEYWDGRTEDNFKKLTGLLKGNYKSIAGLEAIQSSVSGGGN